MFEKLAEDIAYMAQLKLAALTEQVEKTADASHYLRQMLNMAKNAPAGTASMGDLPGYNALAGKLKAIAGRAYSGARNAANSQLPYSLKSKIVNNVGQMVGQESKYGIKPYDFTQFLGSSSPRAALSPQQFLDLAASRRVG